MSIRWHNRYQLSVLFQIIKNQLHDGQLILLHVDCSVILNTMISGVRACEHVLTVFSAIYISVLHTAHISDLCTLKVESEVYQFVASNNKRHFYIFD